MQTFISDHDTPPCLHRPPAGPLGVDLGSLLRTMSLISHITSQPVRLWPADPGGAPLGRHVWESVMVNTAVKGLDGPAHLPGLGSRRATSWLCDPGQVMALVGAPVSSSVNNEEENN